MDLRVHPWDSSVIHSKTKTASYISYTNKGIFSSHHQISFCYIKVCKQSVGLVKSLSSFLTRALTNHFQSIIFKVTFACDRTVIWTNAQILLLVLFYSDCKSLYLGGCQVNQVQINPLLFVFQKETSEGELF